MPTNIDTGLTVQDAVHADHSPHIFTMSNGDLVVLYYNGTNLVWRSKSGGSWSATTTITLDTGVGPPVLSYWTRHGDVILGNTSNDPLGSTNGDWFELTYTPSTHTLGQTNKQIDNNDGTVKVAGVGYTSGATANDQVPTLRASTGLSVVQELNVNPTIVGVDQVPTGTSVYNSSPTSGVVTDGTTTVYLIYGIGTTGTAFAVERFTAGTNADNVESPTAPAANLKGIVGVYDGTNYYFIGNENNAKLRYLQRTGTNTYGSWTDILSDAGITGEPAACVKANGDIAVFYRTTKNQANGEIWVVQRTGGTWGTPALFAGGASTGWSNPSCAFNDVNDSGIARIVYVTGTASTWTLVEDAYTFTTGGGSAPPPAFTIGGPKAQWPNSPTRMTSRFMMTGTSNFPHQTLTTRLPDENDATHLALEQFYGDGTNPAPSNPHARWPNSPVRFTGRVPMLDQPPGFSLANPQNGILSNDLTISAVEEFYGRTDVLPVLPVQIFGLAFAGTSTLVPGIETNIGLSFAFAGTSSLTPGIEVNINPAPSFVGTSSLTLGVEVNINPAPAFAGTSSLTLGVEVNIGLSFAFAGTSTFVPGVEVNINPAFNFAGTSSLVLGAEVNINPSFAFSGQGTLALQPVTGLSSVPFNGQGTLAFTVSTGSVALSFAFAGTSTLTLGAEVNINPAPSFVGQGVLILGAKVNINPAFMFVGLATLVPGIFVKTTAPVKLPVGSSVVSANSSLNSTILGGAEDNDESTLGSNPIGSSEN